MKILKKLKTYFLIAIVVLFSNYSFSGSFTGAGTGFSMSSSVGCALSNYTFTQKTNNNADSKITASKLVTITFPAGTNCATATIAGSTFRGVAITSFISQTGNTITFNSPAGSNVNNKASFVIVIANVTNAPSITSVTCTVVTGNDSGGTNSWNSGYNVTTTACPTVPSNNECSGATSLTPAPAGLGTCTTTNGTTFGATASPQTVCGGQADDDVWYTFQANSTSHQVTVDGIPGFNPQIEVFSGDCSGTLTSMACLNTTGDGGIETANLTGLTVNNWYLVRVYHSLGGFGSTNAASFTICVTSTLPPCNIGITDNYGTTASPHVLPITNVTLNNQGGGNDITASNVQVCGSSSYYGGEDNVIVFKPTTSGNISISLTSSSSWVGIMLYQGCPTGGGTCVAFSQSSSGNQSIGCANVIANQTYYLVVDTYPAPNNIPSYVLNITAPTSGTPAGTTCSNAVPMTLPYTATGQTTLCYGNDYSNASSGSCGTLYESGEDKVYSFTSTGADCFSLTISNASTSQVGYQVYSGCPGSGGTCVASGGGATSGVLTGNFSVSAAGTYFLVVDTYANPSFVNYDIQLSSLGGAPSNDLPCNAQSLTVGVVASGDNQCSSSGSEPDVPTGWTTGNLNTVWYSFVATTTSMKVKVTPGTLTDPQIAVYSGGCGSPTFILANQNTGSCGSTTDYSGEVSLTGLSIGTTYLVRIDGANNLTGTFQVVAIDASMTYPPVQGQDCGSPNPVCNSLMSISNPGFVV